MNDRLEIAKHLMFRGGYHGTVEQAAIVALNSADALIAVELRTRKSRADYGSLDEVGLLPGMPMAGLLAGAIRESIALRGWDMMTPHTLEVFRRVLERIGGQ